jgi:plasmid stabilization system protein ParE
MTLPVVWSPKAEETFDAVVTHIKANWTAREVNNFIDETNHQLERISSFPFSCPESSKYKNVHRCIISKQTSLVYRYKPRKALIEIVTFFDNRCNPKRIKY